MAHAYPYPSSAAVTAAMKGNRRADTKPEIALRAALHALGLRFRKDYLVRPAGQRATRIDIALVGPRVAVFVDGCFWHGCPQHGNTPKANTHYWCPKLARTRARDRRIDAALQDDGWLVVRVWEHVALDDAVALVCTALQRRMGGTGLEPVTSSL